MPNQRAPGKKLLGAQASTELWAALDRWLALNPLQSVTDFVLLACLEKLEHENIPVNRAEVLRDRRARVPRQPLPASGTTANDQSNPAAPPAGQTVHHGKPEKTEDMSRQAKTFADVIENVKRVAQEAPPEKGKPHRKPRRPPAK
jgi:hypothetical protein